MGSRQRAHPPRSTGGAAAGRRTAARVPSEKANALNAGYAGGSAAQRVQSTAPLTPGAQAPARASGATCDTPARPRRARLPARRIRRSPATAPRAPTPGAKAGGHSPPARRSRGAPASAASASAAAGGHRCVRRGAAALRWPPPRRARRRPGPCVETPESIAARAVGESRGPCAPAAAGPAIRCESRTTPAPLLPVAGRQNRRAPTPRPSWCRRRASAPTLASASVARDSGCLSRVSTSVPPTRARSSANATAPRQPMSPNASKAACVQSRSPSMRARFRRTPPAAEKPRSSATLPATCARSRLRASLRWPSPLTCPLRRAELARRSPTRRRPTNRTSPSDSKPSVSSASPATLAPSATRRRGTCMSTRSPLRSCRRPQLRSPPTVARASRTSRRTVQPALSATSPAMVQSSARRPGSRQPGKLKLPPMRAPSKRGEASNTQRKNQSPSGTDASRKSSGPSIHAPTICTRRPALHRGAR